MPQTWEFIPFNHGPRICLGRGVGYFQMEYTLCRIFQHFDRIEGDEQRVQRIKVELNTKMAYPLNIIGCIFPILLKLVTLPTKKKKEGMPLETLNNSAPAASHNILTLPRTINFNMENPRSTQYLKEFSRLNSQLYQTKLPEADILLIQPIVGDMIWTPDSTQLHTLTPAVVAIDAFLDTIHASNQKHCLVFHAFSNAGSHAAVQLVKAYTAVHPSSKLPITGLILDSCPGTPSAILSAKAMILALPRNLIVKFLGAVLIYSIIGVVGLLDTFGLYQNVILKTRRVLNNPSQSFLQSGMERAYLYSQTDVMVPWRDILEHAEEARKLVKDKVVRTIEFTGSGHVGHLSVSREEYADAVMSCF
ncbi:hypothetical protein BDW59DRAFT_171437 [Aspergillus cavernicola]|uniref:Cytochrome P450 n=1 Tax=Aspergillus cavernicola TaxID=176166 RepID=A0ABR4IHA0_9EURO